MAAVNNINKNFLSPLGYKLTLARAPAISYNIQSVRTPGIQMSSGESYTPFLPIPITGKLTYNNFFVTFRVNEDLTDYLEIYNWMIGLGSPENLQQYKTLKDAQLGSAQTLTSDVDLLVMNSAMNPNIRFTFYDAFPIDIGDLEFNTTDSDVNYIECSVEFKYLRYDITLM